jgi:hypothetical protein
MTASGVPASTSVRFGGISEAWQAVAAPHNVQSLHIQGLYAMQQHSVLHTPNPETLNPETLNPAAAAVDGGACMCSLTILTQSRFWRVLYHNPQCTTLDVQHPQMGKVVLKVVPGTRNGCVLQVRPGQAWQAAVCDKQSFPGGAFFGSTASCDTLCRPVSLSGTARLA